MDEIAGVNEVASNSPGEASVEVESSNERTSVETNSTQKEDKRIPYERFQELVDQKNQLKSEVEELRSKVAQTLNKREELSPSEIAFKTYREAGVDEKTAKLLSEVNVKAAEAVANQRVAPVEAAALQQAIDSRVSEFAKQHEDYADLQPRMFEVYRSLPESDQTYISSSAKGLQFLYDHVKANMTEEEKSKAFKDGVKKGYESKKMKESTSPTNGASVKTPSTEWSEEDIANMSLEEYRKNRAAIIASRAPKRR